MKAPLPPAHGLLLFAHGARDPGWARPFEEARARLARLCGGHTPVKLAFLEFMNPTISQAGAELAAQGCGHVTVIPLFLGAGGHVRKDLPVLMAGLQREHPSVQWQLVPAVGETAIVVNALADAAWHLAQPGQTPEITATGADDNDDDDSETPS